VCRLPVVAAATLICIVAAAAYPSAGSEEPASNYAAGLGPEFEKLCVGIRNSFECARAIERKQLSGENRVASRDGSTLALRVRSGAAVKLQDNREPGVEGVSFSYLKSLPEIGFHLVHVQYYEGTAYLLIGMRSGNRQLIQEVPIISPDRARFATVSAAESYNPNGIQIWRLVAGQPKLEWSYAAEGWRPAEPSWLGSERLRIAKLAWGGEKLGTLTAAWSSGAWHLEEP